MSHHGMTDREIRERRADLKQQRESIGKEWRAYEGFDGRQIVFMDRLSDVDRELAQLPRTKASKITRAAILVSLLGAIAVGVYFCFFRN